MRRPNAVPKMPAQSPEDIRASQEWYQALLETSDLPRAARWAVALELMPDWVLHRVAAARFRRSEMEAMNLYGLLSGATQDFYFGDEEPPEEEKMKSLVAGIISITASALAELERRNPQFTRDVIHLEDPFAFDLHNPVTYVPKDPETFDVKALEAYWRELSRTAPQKP